MNLVRECDKCGTLLGRGGNFVCQKCNRESLKKYQDSESNGAVELTRKQHKVTRNTK